MTHPHTRRVCFAGNAISLTYESERLTKMVDFLYGDAAADCAVTPHRRYRLAVEDEQVAGYCNETLIYRGPTTAELADRLLGSSCYYLADRSAGGLLFHAGALAFEGQGVILPGTMGAGKSTLTAWLLTQGFDYLSDELAFVPNSSRQVRGFPRPLNLKRPSRPVLAQWLDFTTPAEGILTSSFTDLVRPTLLRPNNRFSQPPLALILFPNFQANAALHLEPLSKAQAGKLLMECLINARNLSGHGFADISRLVRQTPAYRLTYSHFDQLDRRLHRLFGRGD